jgi:DNA polymerase III delta prime subunit
MKERLTSIARSEGLDETKLNGDQIDAILDVSGGDMRRAVTSLQSVQALIAGATAEGDMVIDETVLAELSGVPPKAVVETLYQALLTTQFDTMQAAVKEIIADGYSVQLLLSKLLDKLMSEDCEDDFDELGRARLAIRIAEAEDRMNEGADEGLQLQTVCGLALKCLQEAKNKREIR